MDWAELRRLVGVTARLEFVDGQVVVAVVLGVNLFPEYDLTYEVVSVVRNGQVPEAQVGTTYIAKLADLIELKAYDLDPGLPTNLDTL